MNVETAQALGAINKRFYEDQHASFAATRQNGWPGWEKVADSFEVDFAKDPYEPYRVLDIGCGNLRFEKFLQNKFPHQKFEFFATDFCDELFEDATLVDNVKVAEEENSEVSRAQRATNCSVASDVQYVSSDVIQLLQQSKPLRSLGFPLAGAAVAFGFVHHVPSANLRLLFMQELMKCVKPGGLVAVSLWQFAEDERMLRKALVSHAQAQAFLNQPNNPGLDFSQLEAGDFFLGWKETHNAWRYCHSFSEDEIKQLIEQLKPQAEVLTSFKADGKSEQLNSYLIFRTLHR